ncbi:MAG: hypothetical protein HYW26_04360 [Candidatus Aenigmarchaeota archaeon]|nr:hypothetical protein [Candidatus Aenigmarchaeota archaeon]
MVFEGTVGLGVALLLITGLAEWAKYKQKRERAFKFLAGAGVLLAASAVFALTPPFGEFSGVYNGLKNLLEMLGAVSALLAVVFLIYEGISEMR